MAEERLRAAVYARLSRSKDAAELGANIKDQREIGEELVSRRGWIHVGTFTDDGRGAYKDDAVRPAWRAMLDARPDVIVVRDVERLGRHPREYVALLDAKARVVDWLNEADADVRWEADPQDPDTDEFQQKTVVARAYSRKIGSKVKRKVRTKAAAGAWPHGGTRAFGYHDHCCRDDTGRVTCTQGQKRTDEEPIILEIAERWLAGETLMALCRDLNERGVATPAGKPWQYARLRAMLSGPRIAGIRTYHGTEHKGAWERIVSEELHRRLVTAASASMVRRAGENRSYVLSGLLACGTCGSAMYGHAQHSQRGVRLRYVCLGSKGCGNGIAADHADEFVSNRSFRAVLAPELRDREESRRDASTSSEQVADLETRLAELDAAYWQQRILSKERWAEQSALLAASLDEARARLAEAKQRLSRERDLPDTAEDLARRWQAADNRERNRLLRVAVERIVVFASTPGRNRFDPCRVEIHFRDGRIDRAAEEDIVREAV